MSILYYFPYYGSQTLIDLVAYAQLRKTWAEILFQYQDCIIAILKKHILKQAIRGGEEKLEILFICNKYKDTFKDLVDSSDVEYPTILKEINLPSNDIPGLKDNSSDPKIDNDLLDRS